VFLERDARSLGVGHDGEIPASASRPQIVVGRAAAQAAALGDARKPCTVDSLGTQIARFGHVRSATDSRYASDIGLGSTRGVIARASLSTRRR
jgi:hypothetical protein